MNITPLRTVLSRTRRRGRGGRLATGSLRAGTTAAYRAPTASSQCYKHENACVVHTSILFCAPVSLPRPHCYCCPSHCALFILLLTAATCTAYIPCGQTTLPPPLLTNSRSILLNNRSTPPSPSNNDRHLNDDVAQRYARWRGTRTWRRWRAA